MTRIRAFVLVGFLAGAGYTVLIQPFLPVDRGWAFLSGAVFAVNLSAAVLVLSAWGEYKASTAREAEETAAPQDREQALEQRVQELRKQLGTREEYAWYLGARRA